METTKIFVVGQQGAQELNSYELMTNSMSEVLVYIEDNPLAEFKTITLEDK